MTTTLPPDAPARMLDVGGAAAMLGVSARHVYRLADSGRMPRPEKLGGANRWDRIELEKWVDDGCPSVAHRGGHRR